MPLHLYAWLFRANKQHSPRKWSAKPTNKRSISIHMYSVQTYVCVAIVAGVWEMCAILFMASSHGMTKWPNEWCGKITHTKCMYSLFSIWPDTDASYAICTCSRITTCPFLMDDRPPSRRFHFFFFFLFFHLAEEMERIFIPKRHHLPIRHSNNLIISFGKT